MQLKKHLVTASYVDESMSMLDQKAKSAGITILGEMGLDPGIGNSNPCVQWSVFIKNLPQHDIDCINKYELIDCFSYPW